MNNTQIVTLRMPTELKRRLERVANHQGISLNQMANYLLNMQVTQLEMITSLESRLRRKSISSLKKSVRNTLQKAPRREVPEWDRIG